MTTSTLYARWLLFALMSAVLGTAIGGCGDDADGASEMPNTGAGTTAQAGTAAGTGMAAGTGAAAGTAASDPNAAAECPGKVYDALSEGCVACACGVDPQLAPSCQKPCWDFLACSFRASAGKCAESAAGGAEMRPQFEACTMEECGAELAVPGAEVVSAYRSIVGACAVAMGETPAACGDDVARFISQLDP